MQGGPFSLKTKSPVLSIRFSGAFRAAEEQNPHALITTRRFRLEQIKQRRFRPVLSGIFLFMRLPRGPPANPRRNNCLSITGRSKPSHT